MPPTTGSTCQPSLTLTTTPSPSYVQALSIVEAAASSANPMVTSLTFTDGWTLLRNGHTGLGAGATSGVGGLGDGFTFPNPQPQPELPPARADRILTRGPLEATAAAVIGCSPVREEPFSNRGSNGFDREGRLYLSDHRGLVIDYRATTEGI